MPGDERSVGMHFERNEENPLDADAVIIDETSMVDIHLMQSLLKAVNPGTRLILVGDVNQLPSVGPGNVLKDVIEAGCFNVVMLTRIFRQASQSDIVVNAHKIIIITRYPFLYHFSSFASGEWATLRKNASAHSSSLCSQEAVISAIW